MQEAPVDHTAAVHAWYNRMCEAAPNEDHLALVELAFARVWERAARTLGGVSLAAILDRVLISRVEEEPILTPLRVTLTGLECEGIRSPATTASPAVIAAAMVRLLSEFLSLTGELTAEIMTPALHAVLASAPLTLHTDQPDANSPAGDGGEKS